MHSKKEEILENKEDNLKKIRGILSSTYIPFLQNSLEGAKRVKSIEEEDEILRITYKRDGINPDQKRELENLLLRKMKGFWQPKNLRFLSVSQSSKDIAGADVKEVAVKPPSKNAELKVGHSQPAPKRQVEGVKKVIAIGSGKGGVGKSCVSLNLALSMLEQGLKVGLIDADVYGPSLPNMLGLGKTQLKTSEDKKILPLEKHGLKLLSFGFFVDDKEPVIWRGPMLGGVINQFLFDADWRGLDVLIVDLPPGTGDVQLSLIQSVELDGVYIVSSPQEVAFLDSLKGLEMFRKMKIPVLGLIENMATFICDSCDKEHKIFGQKSIAGRAKEVGVPFTVSLPLDPRLGEAQDKGEPFILQPEAKKSAIKNQFSKLAKIVSGNLEFKKAGFFSKILS